MRGRSSPRSLSATSRRGSRIIERSAGLRSRKSRRRRHDRRERLRSANGSKSENTGGAPVPLVMTYLPAAFSLLVLAAGWYYLFYSPAAHRLSGIEQPHLNALRIRLRRANGVVMMLLAVAFYAACETVNEFTSKSTAILVLISVPLLLCAMIVL